MFIEIVDRSDIRPRRGRTFSVTCGISIIMQTLWVWENQLLPFLTPIFHQTIFFILTKRKGVNLTTLIQSSVTFR